MYAAMMSGVSLSLLQTAYNYAKDHAVAAGDDVTADVGSNAGFWAAVAPSLGHWVAVTAALAASIAFPMVGSLFILSLLGAAVPVIRRWSKSAALAA